MKICRQCNCGYPDDYVFCLTDGNTLADESGEQETLFRNKIVFPEKTDALSPDVSVECSACGLSNRANSKFCKKCGTALEPVDGSGRPITPGTSPAFGFGLMPKDEGSHNSRARYDESTAFRSSVFTPPTTSGQGVAGNSGPKQTNILIAGLTAGAVLIVGAVIYSSQTDSKKPPSNVVVSNANKTVTNVTTAARNSGAPATYASTSVIGRKGRLITNQHIRSESNRVSQDLGVHYQNAKLEILDEKTYSTDDGSATWYRVRVRENGCDLEGKLGCGNDLNGTSGAAAMEGWMNAKHISLD